MGWFDSLINDVFSGGSNRSAPGSQAASDAYQQNLIKTNARRDTLLSTVTTDKEIDQFTQAELLKQLSGGYLEWGALDKIESTFADSKTSQDALYLNRRAQSNLLKEKKDKPGLAAQTILTQNINGSTTPGEMAGAGGSILT